MRHDPIDGDNQGVADRAREVDLRVGEGALEGHRGGVVALDRDVEHSTGQTLDSVGGAQGRDLAGPPCPSSLGTETDGQGFRFKQFSGHLDQVPC